MYSEYRPEVDIAIQSTNLIFILFLSCNLTCVAASHPAPYPTFAERSSSGDIRILKSPSGNPKPNTHIATRTNMM